MAITKSLITWLEPGFEVPERSQEEDAKRWEVWADMTGTAWAEKNGFPFAVIAVMEGTTAHFMIQRLYEIHGDTIRYGIVRF